VCYREGGNLREAVPQRQQPRGHFLVLRVVVVPARSHRCQAMLVRFRVTLQRSFKTGWVPKFLSFIIAKLRLQKRRICLVQYSISLPNSSPVPTRRALRAMNALSSVCVPALPRRSVGDHVASRTPPAAAAATRGQHGRVYITSTREVRFLTTTTTTSSDSVFRRSAVRCRAAPPDDTGGGGGGSVGFTPTAPPALTPAAALRRMWWG